MRMRLLTMKYPHTRNQHITAKSSTSKHCTHSEHTLDAERPRTTTLFGFNAQCTLSRRWTVAMLLPLLLMTLLRQRPPLLDASKLKMPFDAVTHRKTQPKKCILLYLLVHACLVYFALQAAGRWLCHDTVLLGVWVCVYVVLMMVLMMLMIVLVMYGNAVRSYRNRAMWRRRRRWRQPGICLIFRARVVT